MPPWDRHLPTTERMGRSRRTAHSRLALVSTLASPSALLGQSQGVGVGKGTLLVADPLGGPRFADQRGARAALSLSFVASSTLYLLLVAACSPALPGVFLLFVSRLPTALMHTLPGRAQVETSGTWEEGVAWGRGFRKEASQGGKVGGVAWGGQRGWRGLCGGVALGGQIGVQGAA
jgi:hypothetical protein